MKKYHYKVINRVDKQVLLDSSRREEFDGYDTIGMARQVAFVSASENRIPQSSYVIETFSIEPAYEQCNTTKFAEMRERFLAGDKIHDLELEALLQHYTTLEEHMSAEGERYHFVWRDARDQRDRLLGYKEARKQK